MRPYDTDVCEDAPLKYCYILSALKILELLMIGSAQGCALKCALSWLSARKRLYDADADLKYPKPLRYLSYSCL